MKHNILLGVTGSVAAIHTFKTATALSSIGDVEIALTDSACHFVDVRNDGRLYAGADGPDEFLERLIHDKSFKAHRDQDEWNWAKKGDKILHIELRRWASALVIAPLDANTLAKLSLGLCDNLLTCVFRAWDWTRPVFIAPAMNTMMWQNEPTAGQLRAIFKRFEHNLHIVPPIEKKLACDDIGVGAMAHIDDIVKLVNDRLRWQFPLDSCNGIPINHHPGAFGFHRRKNHHTGVDLYCRDDQPVSAAEDGIVVKVDYFTGPKVGHEWWEETWGVMVEGASGVINYGEVKPRCRMVVGAKVERGDWIGNVKRVLFPNKFRADIPGHSTSMLHLELYKHGTRDFADWHDPQKNPDLLDPTPYLLAAERAPTLTLTWGNEESKPVG